MPTCSQFSGTAAVFLRKQFEYNIENRNSTEIIKAFLTQPPSLAQLIHTVSAVSNSFQMNDLTSNHPKPGFKPFELYTPTLTGFPKTTPISTLTNKFACTWF